MYHQTPSVTITKTTKFPVIPSVRKTCFYLWHSGKRIEAIRLLRGYIQETYNRPEFYEGGQHIFGLKEAKDYLGQNRYDTGPSLGDILAEALRNKGEKK